MVATAQSSILPAARYRIADLTLDLGRRRVARNEQVLHLGKLTYEMLVTLVEAAPNVVTQDDLAARVWSGRFATPETVAQRARLLRLALDDDPSHPRYVEVLRGQGYRLIPPVEREFDAATHGVGDPDHAPSDAQPVATAPGGDRAVGASDARRARRLRPWLAAGVPLIALAGVVLWQGSRETRDSLADSLDRYQTSKLTEFEGIEAEAAISRDGRFVAFLRESEGTWDVWVGLIGTQQYRRLTDRTMPELRNPAVRSLGFTPDGSRVMIWTRTRDAVRGSVVDAGWAVPTLGGSPQPYLRNIAELDWSADGKRIAFHTADAGDPMFVADAARHEQRHPVLASASGLHNHFPLWSRDGAYLYFVHGYAPDEMDLWRVPPSGGKPVRLTFHDSRVSYPTWLGDRTLLYLATADDGSGPWVHAFDLATGTSRRLDTDGRQYSSLSASADGRRIVATESRSTASVWRAPISAGRALNADAATRLDIPVPRGLSPRVGKDFIVYRTKGAGADGINLLAAGVTTELWRGAQGRVTAGPAVSPDGTRIAFPVTSRGRTRLYLVNSDGSQLRSVAEDLDVRGAPAWSPDGNWIAIGALEGGEPRLFKIPVAGGAPVELGASYATDPVWSPGGRFLVYCAEDVGTMFAIKAINADGTPRSMPPLVLSRGSRRVAFLGEELIAVLKGDLSRRELWSFDLRDGKERPLTNFGPGPAIQDFDVSIDGRELVFDRVREDSDIVLMELPQTAPT